MKKKSKIIAGGILITSAIGATTFAIMDPYNILNKKNVEVPEKSLKLTENNDKNKDDIDSKKELDNINLNGIKDGTYLGTSKGYGGDIKVKVTIENGKIKNIEVVSHSETPNYYENGKQIIDSIIKENSINVDAISGATLTSNGIKNAVKDALSKAGFNIDANNKETSSSKNSSKTSGLKANNITENIKRIDLKEYKLKDGEYIGEAIGFKGNVKVKVIINAGKLSDVKIISHNDDDEFFNKAKGVIIKILKNQGTVGVDTISGATYSSRGILNAVNSALNKVGKENYGIFDTIKVSKSNNIPEKNNTTPINIKHIIKDALNKVSIGMNQNKNSNNFLEGHKFKDGEYTGEAEGFKGNVKVKTIIKNSTLVNIEIINHNDDDEFFNNARRLIFKILKNQGTTGVDIVSGATYSSRGILNAVDEALNKAKSQDYIVSNTTNLSENKNTSEKNNENLNNKPKDSIQESKDTVEESNNKVNLDNNERNYLDGKYVGVGAGFTNKPIKSEVIFENNKIKNINVATKESGDYGDDSGFFRNTAIKIVPFLQNNPKETINILLLHDEILDKIFKSDNYYEKGKELIGGFAESLNELPKNSREETKLNKISSCVKEYLKDTKKTSILDVVSGATYSAKGIAKSVQDAMNKSANDFKTGNIINNLEVKTPNNKRIEANIKEKLDLSNLKIIISMKNGTKEEIGYDKFKENDIEIFDRNTGQAIYHGMNLSNRQAYHGIYAVIKHKKSLYKDELLIIPQNIDKNYITGIEYSLDEGNSWNRFSDIKKYKDNINFAQDLKLSKKHEGKNLLLRLISINNDVYLLKPDDRHESLKADSTEYYLKVSDKDRASNINIPSTLRINFKFAEDTHEEDTTDLEKENNNVSDNNPKVDFELPIDKNIKYLDGSYNGIGYGFTGKPIKSEVVLVNNKIRSINVATRESGDYGDDGEFFRNKAMEIVPYLKENPQKTINDLLLHDRIIDEILKSDNYYEKGKELIGNYAEKLKNISNEDSSEDKRGKIYLCVKEYLKEYKKINLFDVVSGATYSAKGIARSVQDAMDKSANDFKTGNVINNLEIKTPNNKSMEVNIKEKLDLSNLKVIISMKNGTKEEIGYDKFKENDIEIYDKNTKKPICNGMDLSGYELYHGIDCIIEHKKSLYKDKLLIIPRNIDKNYITGIEYSIDEGKNWNKFDSLEKYKNNINFKQELKISKEYEGKKILLRLVSDNNTTYSLHPDEEDVTLKVDDKEEYYLEVNTEDKKNNNNIPTLLRVKFKFI
ncbi:FMN-binding protein [Clostridium perfringens]